MTPVWIKWLWVALILIILIPLLLFGIKAIKNHEWKKTKPKTEEVSDRGRGNNPGDEKSLKSEERTVGTGFIAWLDPRKTHTRPIGKVRYTLVGDTSVWIEEIGPANGNDGIDVNKWQKMPAGYYNVTSEDPATYFKWWQ